MNFFSKTKNSNSIIICGWPASGSTFLYQVADSLGLKVKKIHGNKNRKYDNVLSLYTIRDPRDVILSNAKRTYEKMWQNNHTEALIQSLNYFLETNFHKDTYKAILQPNNIIIKYEDYFPNKQEFLVKFIANQYMLPLNNEKIKKIIKNTSIEANLIRSRQFNTFEKYDQTNKIHGNHISNNGAIGGWKNFFSEDIIKIIKTKLGLLLIDLGYEENNDW